MKKLISILLSLALLLSCTAALAEAAEKTTLGNVEVNGVFTVKAKIPEGYEAVDMMDFREENKAWVEVFIMLMPAEGSGKPIYSLTVGMEDVWEKGIKLNDVSDEDLAAIEESFYAEDPDFQITYIESSHGTKILQATDAYDKTGWRIVGETCAAPRNAHNAIDGNYHSLWHSHASGAAPLPPPQSFTVDCGRVLPMRGFDYTPRMDGCRHGMVDGYEFHVSADGQTWTKAAIGEFGNIAANPVRQRVTFEQPAKARYFRFTATHAVEKNDRVAVAEIDIW